MVWARAPAQSDSVNISNLPTEPTASTQHDQNSKSVRDELTNVARTWTAIIRICTRAEEFLLAINTKLNCFEYQPAITNVNHNPT